MPRPETDLPFLRGYLEEASAQAQPSVWPALVSCGGVFAGSVALGWALFQWIGWVGIPVTLVFGVPGIAALIGVARAQAGKARTPEARKLMEIRRAAAEMHALKKRRLVKRLGVPLASLLEEAARHYYRAQAALNGPFWTSPNLPSHWRIVREQALASAAAGMGDLLLLAHSLMSPSQEKPAWHEEVREVLDEILGKPVLSGEFVGTFPPEFEPARAIAERLRSLAEEVESATMMVLQDGSSQAVGSVGSLDATLHELRQVRQAEDEMRQNLSQQQ
ncbi:MAG: hypothetical protein LDL55_12165 [Armatimonadetes bacterium]|nr:hypothetical protein [Armatimonadota bacterium]